MARDIRSIARGGPGDTSFGFCPADRTLSGSQCAESTQQDQVQRLYDNFRLPIFRYLICLGSSPDDADEILQETFLRAYQHLRAGRINQNLRGWVFRVAHNLAVTRFKKQCRIFARGTEFADATISAADPPADAETLLLSGERLRRISAAVKTLSPQERQCMNLRAEGLRYCEIADIIGIEVSTVADSVRRAIAKLGGGEG
jgi:RNA polymerase sigma-70 factor (ECF subfamily)